MTERVLFTIGSVLRGDDAAGPLLAKMVQRDGVDGWEVVDGGQTPEDELRTIRRLAPDFVVVVDAADMGLPPGSIRRLAISDVAVSCLITTHALPMTFLLGELEQMAKIVVFLGIQPADTTFFNPLTPAVLDAVEDIYSRIVGGVGIEDYPMYQKEELANER